MDTTTDHFTPLAQRVRGNNERPTRQYNHTIFYYNEPPGQNSACSHVHRSFRFLSFIQLMALYCDKYEFAMPLSSQKTYQTHTALEEINTSRVCSFSSDIKKWEGTDKEKFECRKCFSFMIPELSTSDW